VAPTSEVVAEQPLERRLARQRVEVGLERVEDELEHVGVPETRLSRRLEAQLEGDDVGAGGQQLTELRVEQP
jgi:hypothetical protein